jgi:hypothetical protein
MPLQGKTVDTKVTDRALRGKADAPSLAIVAAPGIEQLSIGAWDALPGRSRSEFRNGGRDRGKIVVDLGSECRDMLANVDHSGNVRLAEAAMDILHIAKVNVCLAIVVDSGKADETRVARRLEVGDGEAAMPATVHLRGDGVGADAAKGRHFVATVLDEIARVDAIVLSRAIDHAKACHHAATRIFSRALRGVGAGPHAPTRRCHRSSKLFDGAATVEPLSTVVTPRTEEAAIPS